MLKPCPFCGATTENISLERTISIHWIKCNFCQSEGLKSTSSLKAKQAWNNRPIENELLEVLEKLINECEHLMSKTEIAPYKRYVEEYKGGE